MGFHFNLLAGRSGCRRKILPGARMPGGRGGSTSRRRSHLKPKSDFASVNTLVAFTESDSQARRAVCSGLHMTDIPSQTPFLVATAGDAFSEPVVVRTASPPVA